MAPEIGNQFLRFCIRINLKVTSGWRIASNLLNEFLLLKFIGYNAISSFLVSRIKIYRRFLQVLPSFRPSFLFACKKFLSLRRNGAVAAPWRPTISFEFIFQSKYCVKISSHTLSGVSIFHQFLCDRKIYQAAWNVSRKKSRIDFTLARKAFLFPTCDILFLFFTYHFSFSRLSGICVVYQCAKLYYNDSEPRWGSDFLTNCLGR